jgi:glutathione reductase (NADPH)
VLVGAASAVAHARLLRGHGVAYHDLAVRWSELIAFKRTFTDPVPRQREHAFARDGIDTFHGAARFVDSKTIASGNERLEARNIVIASGALPRPLDISGQQHLATSDDFLELRELPRRIAFVGGGFIALELAHIARHAGADVIVLQRGERLLRPFDRDLVDLLTAKTRKLGIDVRLATTVLAIDKVNDRYDVRTAHAGTESTIEADLAVHAGGRAPAIEALDLDAGNVAHRDGRLELNEFLQSTSNASVYAAGDAAEYGPPLTPVAGADGRLVAANILDGNHMRADYTVVPSVVFTTPPLAAVGMRPEDAERAGLRFRVHQADTSTWYSSRRVNETAAAYKVLVEEPSGRILGAHLLGPYADEVINVFAVALRAHLSANDLMSMTFGYPTSASDIAYMLEP